MSAAAMIRVIRAREMYGFVRGRLDSTREALDWAVRAMFASVAIALALAASAFAGVLALSVLLVYVVATGVGLLLLVRALSRLEDTLCESLDEARAECDAAHAAFECEYRAAMQSTEATP